MGGYGERRKTGAGRPAQGGLFLSKGGFGKIEENTKIKLLSPLTAELVPNQWMDNDDVQDLDGREILPYYAVVKEAVDQYADDLLPFYDGPEDIKTKLESILPTVEVHEGKLYGCAVVACRQDLSERQWNDVMEYICALPGFVDSKNEEKTERNAGYLVVSHSGGGMLRQGTRKGIRRTPANRGMRAHRIVKSLDISEDVCHGMCP